MADSGMITVLLSLILWTGCEAWDFCRNNYYSGYIYAYTSYIYCEYGCCGSYYEQSCCSNIVGIICGAVFGGLVVLGILIGVVICCVQSKGHRGTVVHPGTTPTHPNITAVAVVHQPYQTYTGFTAQPIGPPPYTLAPPPAYGQYPAYPPTTAFEAAPLSVTSHTQPTAPNLLGAAGTSTGQVSDLPPPGNKR